MLCSPRSEGSVAKDKCGDARGEYSRIRKYPGKYQEPKHSYDLKWHLTVQSFNIKED